MLFFQGILTCFFLAVMWFDLTRYVIPNWLVGVLLALYPLMLLSNPIHVPWVTGLLMMALVFAAGYAAFALRWMGGGDIKLLTACALWTGPVLLEFLIYTALFGGAMSILLWLARPAVAWYAARQTPAPAIPKLLTIGEPVPYGLAIATAFLLLLWLGHIPGLPV